MIFVSQSCFDFRSDFTLKVSKMSKAHPPELKKFMDKKISLRINGSRQVSCFLVGIYPSWKFSLQVEGILCGFDPFMNLVLDDATEFNKDGSAKGKIGMKNYLCKSRELNQRNYCRPDRGEGEQCGHAGGKRQALNIRHQQSEHFLSKSTNHQFLFFFL